MSDNNTKDIDNLANMAFNGMMLANRMNAIAIDFDRVHALMGIDFIRDTMVDAIDSFYKGVNRLP